jgi:Tfp pilus assembly protein PilO
VTIGNPLLRRVAREHRRLLLPLAVALVVNVLAYAFIVYPLSQRVANIEEREQAAARELTAGQREHRQAAGTLTGKDRAAQELDRFYNEVLPRNLPAARELTFTRLPQLAGQFDVLFGRRTYAAPAQQRESNLVQLRTQVELAGRYNDIRSFIHELESSQEFVVIDNIRLSEEQDEDGLLQLQIDLSTYYRAAVPVP